MVDSAQNTKKTLDALAGLGDTLRNNRSLGNIIISTSDFIDQAKKTKESYQKTYESLKNTTARAGTDFKKLVKTVNSTKYGNKFVTAASNRYNAASSKAKNISTSMTNKINNFTGTVKNKVTGSNTYKKINSNKYVQKAKGALTKENLKTVYGDSKTAFSAVKSVIETTGNAKDTANSAKSMYSNLKNRNYAQAAKDGAQMLNSGYKTATSGYKAFQGLNETYHTKTAQALKNKITGTKTYKKVAGKVSDMSSKVGKKVSSKVDGIVDKVGGSKFVQKMSNSKLANKTKGWVKTTNFTQMKSGLKKMNEIGSGAKALTSGFDFAKNAASSFGAGKDFVNSFKQGSGKEKTTNVLNAGATFANSLSTTISSAGDFVEAGAKFAQNFGKVANLGDKVGKFAGKALDKAPLFGTVAQGFKAVGSTANAMSNIMNGKGADIEDSTLLKIADGVGGVFGKSDDLRNWIQNTKSGQVISNFIVAGEDIAELNPVVGTVMDVADVAVDAARFIASGDAKKAVQNGINVAKSTFNNAKKTVKTTLTNIQTGAKKTLKRADQAVNKGINKLTKVSATAGAAARGAYN